MTNDSVTQHPELNTEGQAFMPDKQTFKRLRGWYLIVILFIIIAVASFFPVVNLAMRTWFDTWDIFEVGTQLVDYAKKNGNQFPKADRWCDIMLDCNDDYSFKRYEDAKESFPYTLNSHVFECNSIPDNMVILFSGIKGWNKIGDANSVINGNKIVVFLGDGQFRTYRKNHISYLRWKYQDTGIIPNPAISILCFAISLLLAVGFASILIAYRKYLRIFWIFALSIGLPAAVTGVWLGSAAEDVYYKFNTGGIYIALYIGSICGFLVGVSFVLIIGKIYAKYNAKVSMLGYATVIGAVAGVIASSIVHTYLMVMYEERSFDYMMAGSCFGIMAGLMLGWISSGAIRFYKNNPAILTSEAKSK